MNFIDFWSGVLVSIRLGRSRRIGLVGLTCLVTLFGQFADFSFVCLAGLACSAGLFCLAGLACLAGLVCLVGLVCSAIFLIFCFCHSFFNQI